MQQTNSITVVDAGLAVLVLLAGLVVIYVVFKLAVWVDRRNQKGSDKQDKS